MSKEVTIIDLLLKSFSIINSLQLLINFNIIWYEINELDRDNLNILGRKKNKLNIYIEREGKIY